jgi:hypothetical protein
VYEGNDTSYLIDKPHIALDGTIELTFDQTIPIRSTTLRDEVVVKLARNANGTSTVATLPAVIDGSTLKIKPVNPFTGGATYCIA